VLVSRRLTRPVIVDGYTQPGAATNGNALADGFNGRLLIEISGAIVGNNGNGLNVDASLPANPRHFYLVLPRP